MKTLLDDFESIAIRINKYLNLITTIGITCLIITIVMSFSDLKPISVLFFLVLVTMWFLGTAMIGHMYGQTTIVDRKCQYSRIGKMRNAPSWMQSYQMLFTAMWFTFLIVGTFIYIVYLFV
jgi:hypothetical protein